MTGAAESATTASVIATAPPDLQFDFLDHPDDGLLPWSTPRAASMSGAFRGKRSATIWRSIGGARGTRQTSPNLHFIVARAPGSPRHVLGFIAASTTRELAAGSSPIFVFDEDPPQRRGRLRGSSLGVEVLRDDALAAGVELRAVFAEIDDPAKAEGDGRTRWRRSTGSERCTRWARAAYRSPTCSLAGPAQVPALMLVAFPIDGRPVESLDRRSFSTS